MAQESIKGWGGAREGGGRKSAVPLGAGDVRAVSVRTGEELLDALKQRWPDLPNDSERIRAAMWEAVGTPKT